MDITESQVRSILTRTSGFLLSVASHSLQPYRGCSFGRSLCGVGCYVQHNPWLTRGAGWGGFLEARTNAAEAYLRQVEAERAWARNKGGRLGIFMSSATDPFVPQEDRFRVTERVLHAMLEAPPDLLIVQTHTHRVTRYRHLYPELARRCELRFHLSIETDLDRVPGLPPPASPVEKRFEAARRLRADGHRVVIAVAPLLPLARPAEFFARIADCADAVILDHWLGGDGTPDGSGARTRRTGLPAATAALDPSCVELEYRDRMVALARRHLPGRVGVSIDGFAGRFLPG